MLNNNEINRRGLDDYISASPVAIFVTDSTGTYIFVNQAAEKLTGYSSAELLTMKIPQLLPAKNEVDAMQKFELLKVQGHYHSRATLLKKNRCTADIVIDTVAIDPNQFLVCCRDVTGQLISQRRLKRQSQLMQAINRVAGELLSTDGDIPFQEIVNIIGVSSLADRTYIFLNHQNSDDSTYMNIVAEWSKTGITPQADNFSLQNIKYKKNQRNCISRLAGGEIICSRVSELPTDERSIFEAQQIVNIYMLPFYSSGNFYGFIGFDYCHFFHEVTDVEKYYLGIVASFITKQFLHLKSEKSLTESEGRYRSIFENMPAPMLIIDPVTHFIVNANQAALNFYGWNHQQLTAMSIGQINQLSPSQLNQKIKTIIAQRYQKFVVCHKIADGTVKNVEIFTGFVTIQSKSYILSLVNDITEKTQLEIDRAKSEQKYSELFNQMSSGFTLNEIGQQLNGEYEFRFLEINPAFEEITGLKKETVLGKKIREVFPDISSEWFTLYNQVVQSKQAASFEIYSKIIKKHLLVAVYIPFPGQIATILTDITQSKKIEAELEQSKVTYRGILNSISELIYVQDELGHFLFINETVEKTYGYKREDFIGRTPDFLSAPGKNDMTLIAQATALAFKGIMQTFEFWAITKDGRIFPKEVCMSPGVYFGKKVVITVARDISERKRDEAEKIEVQKKLLHTQKLESIGVLAGGIAHDFNNLLAAILGNLEYLFFKEIDDAEIVRHISNAKEGVNKAALLTKQLLAYSGKSSYNIQNLDVNSLIADNVELFRTVIGKNISFETTLFADLPLVEGDESQLQQVVMNLLTNAAEAIGNSVGVINLSTGYSYYSAEMLNLNRLPKNPDAGNFVFIEITDNGCGMSEEVIERIFEPFFTTKFTGRGLGMAAMQGIVEAHRGGLFLQSTQGKGSTFRVLLPATGEFVRNKPAAPKSSLFNKSPKFSGTIILADDEEMVLSIEAMLLEKLGFKVLQAVNGRIAVELFKAHRDQIDGILLDMTMPELDGPATAKAIREIDEIIPIIIISGFDGSDQSISLNNIQHNAFIHKPFRIEELTESLNKVFGNLTTDLSYDERIK